LVEEPYDLVLRTSSRTDQRLTPLWTLLDRSDFRDAVEALGGYSCAEMVRRIR
jgi:putative molybdopterin biosynthesis protein